MEYSASSPRVLQESTPRDQKFYSQYPSLPALEKFTFIIWRKWLMFMSSNGYMDSTVQKSFLPGIYDCTEQSIKIAIAVCEAHSKHCSISVCCWAWRMPMAVFTMVSFNFPIDTMVLQAGYLTLWSICMYSNLQSIIMCPEWSTNSTRDIPSRWSSSTL